MTEVAVESLHREVQRKLGRCLIRLQQYERLLKKLLPMMNIETTLTPGLAPHTNLQASAERLQRQTLGGLVSEFLGIHTEPGREVEQTEAAVPEGGAVFRSRVGIEVLSGGLTAVEADLRSMVVMRNDLVHHFLERFDLWTVSGCQEGSLHLDECFERIDRLLHDLDACALTVQAMHQQQLVALQSAEFQRLISEGIFPDRTIHWPYTKVVCCLRQRCDVDPVSWVALRPVIDAMHVDCPEEVPSKYGCRNWRQLLRRSGLFDVRTDLDEKTGQGRTWFRANPVAIP